MSKTDRTATCVTPERAPLAVRLSRLALLLLPVACTGERGPTGEAGPPGTGGNGGTGDQPTATDYVLGAAVPELRIEVQGLAGASGPGGEFLVGDTVSVDFSLMKEDGSAWTLDELSSGEALLSGPSVNYQRVLPLAADVRTRAVTESPGLFRYTFEAPLPATFAAPYNDSPSFGPGFGDLGGRDLVDGTYTAGLSLSWAYRQDGKPGLRVAEATFDFLLGTGAGPLAHREVSRTENCNRCHTQLEAHEGRYRSLAMCVLCHTSGAEDANDPSIAGGTPGVTIDSRVLFHKIHNGRYLPSVNGVATRGNGNRNYGAQPQPLLFARPDGTVRDFSTVGFPAMPGRVFPMPRDSNYDTLGSGQALKEDVMLLATAQCSICHGDPDGDGPLEAPAQGDLIYPQMSRKACGSCHDDVNFGGTYRSNGQAMPPQGNDGNCNSCHDSRFPGPLSPRSAHIHPMLDPEINPGLRLTLLSWAEAGTNDFDGTLDPGEALALSFSLHDDAGAEVDPAGLDEVRVVVSGPTANFQLLLDQEVATSLLTGPQPFELVLPEHVALERIGTSGAGLDEYLTARAPHRPGPATPTRVHVRVTVDGGARITAAAARFGGFVDVDDSSAFQRGDYALLDDGNGAEEYVRVHLVDGARIWFGEPDSDEHWPGLRQPHAAGATIDVVRLAEAVQGLDYSVDPALGSIRELREFGPGRVVLASYTTDWVLPGSYPAPHHDSDERGELEGEWTGRSLVAGTYSVALLTARDFTTRLGTAITPYRTSASATVDFLALSAAQLEPAARIADGASCNTCHQDLTYHDEGWHGFDSCLVCHGVSGSEDLPRRVAPNAPGTAGTSVEFRTLIHRIHRGRESVQREPQVVGEGPGAYPDNFVAHGYGDFSPLPAFPERTLQCERCHGDGNLEALLPADRAHPAQGFRPVATWRPVCATCHDDLPAVAHIDSNTAPNGAEACAICHERGEFEDAVLAHGKSR